VIVFVALQPPSSLIGEIAAEAPAEQRTPLPRITRCDEARVLSSQLDDALLTPAIWMEW
jgi:hypothetical protein